MCTQLRVEMRELRWCPEIVPAPSIQLAADAVLADPLEHQRSQRKAAWLPSREEFGAQHAYVGVCMTWRAVQQPPVFDAEIALRMEVRVRHQNEMRDVLAGEAVDA